MRPFDENDLIAYHLRELSPRRTRALERALHKDPALAAESAAYAAMLSAFKGCVPLEVDEKVVERNWRALRPALPAHTVRPSSFLRWHLPALAGVGLAFAATSVFIATHHHSATSMPLTAAMRQSADTVQAMRSVDNSFVTNARTGVPFTEQRGKRREEAHTANSLEASLTMQPQDSPPRIVASVRRVAEPAPTLPFIPPAPAPEAVPPAPSSIPVTIEPATPLQVTASDRPSKLRRQRISFHRDHLIDLTLAMGGTFIGTRYFTSDGITHSQGATHAVSAVASFHQQLRPAIGYRIAMSYTRPGFDYSYRTGNTLANQSEINGRIYELAGTYVIQGPHRGIVSTSAEAGAGVMGFLPSVKSSDTGYNVRGAAVAGVAAEFAMTKHLAARAAYRVQAFKGPDFQYSGNGVPAVTTTLFSNEPTVGITYRFSHK